METVLVYYNRKIQRERVRKGRIKIRNRRDWDLEMKNKDTERDLIIIRLWFVIPVDNLIKPLRSYITTADSRKLLVFGILYS